MQVSKTYILVMKIFSFIVEVITIDLIIHYWGRLVLLRSKMHAIILWTVTSYYFYFWLLKDTIKAEWFPESTFSPQVY